jgi:hypothetical protein
METTFERTGSREAAPQEKAAASGSIIELIAGAGAIVLPILGLIGVLPMSLAAISFIAIGGGMMMQASAVGVERSAGSGSRSDTAELYGGMSAEVLGGAAVTALGILALLRIVPVTLMAVAAIVAGGALVLGAGTTSRLSSLRYRAAGLDEEKREILRESINAAAGADVLVGLGAIVLGILVIAGVGGAAVHLTLILVSALALGSALLLNGTTVGARMAALLRH